MATTSIHIRKQSQAFGGAPKRARRDEQEEADAAAAVTESSTLDYSSSSSSSSSSSEDSSDRGKRVKLNPMDDLIADCMAAFQHAVGWGTNMGAESFHATIQTVRRLLFQQKDEESVRKFIVRGLLALVSETLRIWGDYDAKDGPYPSLIQYEAIWILVELTSREETSLTNTVVMSGIVKMENLTKFMNKIQVKVRENAVWLLANICGGHDAFRSEASQNRDLLVALIGSFEKGAQVDNRPLLKVCSFATGNLVREANGQAAPMELVLFLVPVVSMMLKHMVEKKFNTFSVIDLFVALKSMLAHSNAVREALFRHGIVDTLFTALELYTSQRAIEGMIILPILQCLAELAAGAVASHVAAVACHRILFFADAFLDRNSSHRDKYGIALVFTKIAASGSLPHIRWLLSERKVMSSLAALAVNDHKAVQQQALWLFVNLVQKRRTGTHGRDEVTCYFKFKKGWCEYLQRGVAADVELVIGILEALHTLICSTVYSTTRCSLTMGKTGRQAIELFLDYPNDIVSNWAAKVVGKLDEDEEESSPEQSYLVSSIIVSDSEESGEPDNQNTSMISPPPSKVLFPQSSSKRMRLDGQQQPLDAPQGNVSNTFGRSSFANMLD